ncbi:MAG: DUF2029 domain-containing protein [Ignavibacteriales bacterium]|nr:DUF2029 domain-containing protein [Ignavibacteriales bacterium]
MRRFPAPSRLKFHAGLAFLLAGVAVHILFLLSLKFGFLNPLFDDAMHRKGQGADFYAVVQAGQNFSDGVSIYTTSPRRQVVPYYYPYRYHPFVAYTFGQLFLLLPPIGAYGLWIILLEFVLIVNLVVTRKLISDERSAMVLMGIWLLFSPFYLELYLGQFSFAMASLLFWALVAWERNARRIGDSSWIVSLIVKSNSVLLTPALLKQGRWKLVAMGAGVAILLAVPYFASVPGTYQEFARNYTKPMSMPQLLGNQGFAGLIGIAILRMNGLWTDDLHELHARLDQMDRLMQTPLSVWTAVILLLTLLVTIRAQRERRTDLFLLWILSYFLFYKHVWEHHYVMLLPVFVLLYLRITTGKLNLAPGIFWGTFSIIALPTLFPLIDLSNVLFDPELYWETWKSFLYHVPKPLAVLLLYGALCLAILHKSKDPEGQQSSLVRS